MRAQRNRSIKSAVKTKVTKFRRALVERDERAEDLALVAVSALDRAAAKGVLHRNNAARRKARVARRLNASGMGVSSAPAAAEVAAAKPSRRTKAATAPARKPAAASAKTTSSARTAAPAKPTTRSSSRAR